MADSSYSHHLVPVPKSWKSHFKVKPECEYKDVMKMEFHVWKPEALRRGYLMRKAERKRLLQKDWTSCYTVISANLVLLFKDCKQSTNKPLEYTTLSPDDNVTVLVETKEKHKFCFAIKTAHKDDSDWVFSASNPDDRTMWVAAFEAVFDFMKYGRIKKWSLQMLKKEKFFMGDPETENGKGTLKHEYTDITYKEICAKDVETYDFIQPDEKWNDLTDMELSILAGKFGNQWKAFAREKLLLNQSEIECIEGENKNNLKEQMFSALVRWKRKQDGPNTKAKLIALLKNSPYCDNEAWLCLEKPGYVTLKQECNDGESSSHTYCNVTSGKQAMQPGCSRPMDVASTPGTRKTPTRDGQSSVKGHDQNKKWEVATAEMKAEMKQIQKRKKSTNE